MMKKLSIKLQLLSICIALLTMLPISASANALHDEKNTFIEKELVFKANEWRLMSASNNDFSICEGEFRTYYSGEKCRVRNEGSFFFNRYDNGQERPVHKHLKHVYGDVEIVNVKAGDDGLLMVKVRLPSEHPLLSSPDPISPSMSEMLPYVALIAISVAAMGLAFILPAYWSFCILVVGVCSFIFAGSVFDFLQTAWLLAQDYIPEIVTIGAAIFFHIRSASRDISSSQPNEIRRRGGRQQQDRRPSVTGANDLRSDVRARHNLSN
ncbi:hypothetical protein [Enterovibrio norvegicus]|uniref:hypothetical protein n=1 Tax=Enterovibrio norvegicus TaxID=188144 RepID=UPI00352E9A1A